MDDNFFDVIVIGGGPAGLTAAIYLARARYRVLVIEKEHFGGQITITSEVVNYPGVPGGSGEEITTVMRNQAQNFGSEFMLAEVTSVDLMGQEKIVRSSRGEFRSFGVIIATGAQPRRVGFIGEEEFKGRGVAYCATCDGEFFTGLDVFVVGGGFAAAEEAVFLTRYARQVIVLGRNEDFSCAKTVADAVKAHDKIKIHYNTEVESVSGDDELRVLKARNRVTGETWEYSPPTGESFGVFVFAGYEPAVALVKDQIELDEQGYIKADQNGKTNLGGVYAAGDVRQKVLRQMVTATSDGAVAAAELERYVAGMQQQTGRTAVKPDAKLSKRPTPTSQMENTIDAFFSPEVREQLDAVFQKMESKVILRLELDERPASEELKTFIEELANLTDRISVQYAKDGFSKDETPCVRLLRQGGEDTGLAFHGVPGGHEFNSFVLGLYNVAGPGQSLDKGTLAEIRSISKKLDMKILVSLTCTMCPELVVAAQRMAAENNLIRTEVYDLNHFPQLRERYKVMSVPCLVLNESTLSFGKKNITQLLSFLKDYQNP